MTLSTIQQVWTTKDCERIEHITDDLLHFFRIHCGGRTVEIAPHEDDVQDCIRRLDEGECPVADGWEDGFGNSVSEKVA